jgi:hypothetical protein
MDPKKQAAAIAGVIAFIRTQEDMACMQGTLESELPRRLEAPRAPLKIWGISGRQTQMLMRNHMQLKSYHR